jgi:uncharacterized coiled-coil DUF342 family protein
MEEKQLLSQEEINKLKWLQDKNLELNAKFGSLEYQIQTLLLDKQEVVKELEGYRVKQTQISQELQEKYGDGYINIETGEFTKS